MKGKLFLNCEKTGVRTFNSPFPGELGVFFQKRPGEQRDNQDSAGHLWSAKKGLLLVLADGMGGHAKGDEASALAVRTVLNAFKKARTARTMTQTVIDGLQAADQEIKSWGVGAGTTLVAAHVQNQRLRFFSVGDSPAYLIGPRGLLKYKATEHSVVGYGLEAGLISEQKALGHDQSNVVLNALGGENFHIALSSSLELASHDLVLLCSDGLSDNLQTEKLIDLVTKGAVAERCQALASEATAQMVDSERSFGGPDDLSFFLYRNPSFRTAGPVGPIGITGEGH